MDTKLRAYSAGVLEATVLVAAAVVPVFVNFYSFRVFELDKHAVFLALMTLAALGGLVALGEGRGRGLRRAFRQPLVVAALLLGLTGVVATAASIVPRISLFGSHGRAQGLMALLGVLVLFGAVAWVAMDPARRRRIVAVLLLASAPVAALAVVQALGVEVVPGEVESKARAFGTLSNPIFLGAYLMLVFPLTVVRAAAAVRARRGLLFAVLTLLGILQLAALVTSDSRGPLLGLGAGLGVMLLAGAVATGRRRLVLSLVGLAVLGAVFLVVFNQPGSALAPLREVPVLGRFGQIADLGQGSQAVRVRIWTAVNRLLAGEPRRRLVVGNGLESLKYALLPYGEANMAGPGQADRLVDRAHNVLLDALVMTGVPGALALLLVYGAWLFSATSALGLVPTARHGRWLAGLLGAGTALGAASWLVLPTYAGALTLLGLTLGLVSYLLLVLWRGEQPAGPLNVTALGLLAVGAAAVVEAAFGIQTVVTQAVFWLLAGLLVATSLGDPEPEATRARSNERPEPRMAKPEAAGQVVVRWSVSSAALGLAVGAVMSSLAFSFFLYGATGLPPAATGVWVLLVLLTWLAGLFLAADAGENPAACAITGPIVLALYLILRAVTLTVSRDAAVLFAVTVWWFLALALLGGFWLRGRLRRAPLWQGAAGMLYAVPAVMAVAFVFWRGVQPVQADIYFQSALATMYAAVVSDTQGRAAEAQSYFQTAEALYSRAERQNPHEPLYPMMWGERYVELGAAMPDLEAAAPAFGRAQELVSRAEKLEPLMPYHVYNRGHLQLVFAQRLSPDQQAGQRESVAQQAEVALAQAFDALSFDPKVANELAQARLLQGRTDEAVALLEYSLTLDEANPETYMLLGRAHAAAGQLDVAEQQLEKALRMGVGGAELLVALADVARERDDLSAALNYYRQASQEEPDNWGLLFNLGLLHWETGGHQEALEILMQAMQLAPASERDRIQQAIDTVMGGTGPVPTLP